MKYIRKLLAAFCLSGLSACMLFSACGAPSNVGGEGDGDLVLLPEQTETIPETPPETPDEVTPFEPEEPEKPEESKPSEGNEAVPSEPAVVAKAEYVKVTASGVNIRSGAGSGYASYGVAEKGTLYACLGKVGNWIKTTYKNKTAYIYGDYCTSVQMSKASDEIENVIAEGCKCLGVPYVYGATRYMDGNGNRLSGFSTNAFDCSSLMQYIFKQGAGVNLQVNTRTQIYQGKTVAGALKRGDLMFFTNASRKNNTGIERVGHVALYLGDNYILHTASDYAKIELISSTRWSYYIQAQRIV